VTLRVVVANRSGGHYLPLVSFISPRQSWRKPPLRLGVGRGSLRFEPFDECSEIRRDRRCKRVVLLPR
jgi:hypothetical protein